MAASASSRPAAKNTLSIASNSVLCRAGGWSSQRRSASRPSGVIAYRVPARWPVNRFSAVARPAAASALGSS